MISVAFVKVMVFGFSGWVAVIDSPVLFAADRIVVNGFIELPIGGSTRVLGDITPAFNSWRVVFMGLEELVGGSTVVSEGLPVIFSGSAVGFVESLFHGLKALFGGSEVVVVGSLVAVGGLLRHQRCACSRLDV